MWMKPFTHKCGSRCRMNRKQTILRFNTAEELETLLDWWAAPSNRQTKSNGHIDELNIEVVDPHKVTQDQYFDDWVESTCPELFELERALWDEYDRDPVNFFEPDRFRLVVHVFETGAYVTSLCSSYKHMGHFFISGLLHNTRRDTHETTAAVHA